MKHFLTSFFLLLSVISYAQLAQSNASYNSNTSHMEPFHISVDTYRSSRIIEQQGSNLVLIDVRTPDEIANGKINNALEIDIKSPDFSEKIAQLDKTKQYLVYDYAGGRSKRAMDLMRELGFKQVYELKDGYKAWKEINLAKK